MCAQLQVKVKNATKGTLHQMSIHVIFKDPDINVNRYRHYMKATEGFENVKST